MGDQVTEYQITINGIEPCIGKPIGFKANTYYLPDNKQRHSITSNTSGLYFFLNFKILN